MYLYLESGQSFRSPKKEIWINKVRWWAMIWSRNPVQGFLDWFFLDYMKNNDGYFLKKYIKIMFFYFLKFIFDINKLK